MKKKKRSKEELEKLYARRRNMKTHVECWCPRCEKNHIRRLNWRGKLPAKKLCRDCREYSMDTLAGSLEIHEITVRHRDYVTMLDLMGV